MKVTNLLNQTCVWYCWIRTRNLKMMLLLDFAVACVDWTGLHRWKQKKKKKKKNNTETGSITILTESTSRSIINASKIFILLESYVQAAGSCASCTTSASAMPYADRIPAYLEPIQNAINICFVTVSYYVQAAGLVSHVLQEYTQLYLHYHTIIRATFVAVCVCVFPISSEVLWQIFAKLGGCM